MRFCIDDYPGRYVMHCITHMESSLFSQYLHKSGRCWSSGKDYLSWDMYARANTDPQHDGLSYNFNNGTCKPGIEWYIENGFEILEFSDFEWDDYTAPKQIDEISTEELLHIIDLI